jgi:hypothetical protein|tara:strand:- start:67 stop:336 length:270 start_codon:yes stop_codon:yes gene_type:complete
MKVKIEQRSVYHKFVELEIDIPDSVDTDMIDEYLLSIEKDWINVIDDKINQAEFVHGTGLYDHHGHEDSEVDDEWRYECKERKISGHLH